jgi:cytochrome c-type biogenesis protein CcmH
MTAFVAAATVLTLLAMGAVLFGPRLRRGAAAKGSRAWANAEVLRQQLVEMEAERRRGLLDETEFARLRDDLQCRLLAEAGQGPMAVPPPAVRARGALYAATGVLPLAAVLLYLQFGHPQLISSPVSAGAQALADPAAAGEAMMARLEAHLASTPGDARGWVMLARARMQLDQFEAAAAAYQRALDASTRVARDPLVWCEYADALGMAAGGRLAGQPRQLIDKALALDPAHPRALEMAGSAAYEAGDYAGAGRYWKQLLALLPAGAPEYAELAAAIARAEQRARVERPAS